MLLLLALLPCVLLTDPTPPPSPQTTTNQTRHKEPPGWKKTIEFFFSFIMLVDLLALAPYYFKTIVERLLPDLASAGLLRSLRMIRIFRVLPFYMHMIVSTKGIIKADAKPHLFHLFDLTVLFKALRLGDYAAGAPLFFTTLRASLPAIVVAVIASICMTMMFGTAMFVAERGVFQATPEYPDGAYLVRASSTNPTLVEGAHANIFMSMWYVISDTTTSKSRAYACLPACLWLYAGASTPHSHRSLPANPSPSFIQLSTVPTIGMLTPVTAFGEIMDVVIDYLSLIVLTLPIAIIGRNFHDQYESFFRNWDVDDIEWSSDEEDRNNEAEALDDYDTALVKLKQGKDKLNNSISNSNNVLDSLAEEGKASSEEKRALKL